jgi:hypothetical protein
VRRIGFPDASLLPAVTIVAFCWTDIRPPPIEKSICRTVQKQVGSYQQAAEARTAGQTSRGLKKPWRS